MEAKNPTTRNNTPDTPVRVILLFGSNQGDRAAAIDRAISFVASIGDEECRSTRYESAPWGFHADTPFYNQVIAYRTTLSPTALLHHCLETERRLGRARSPLHRYTSRPIDIDILFYGDRVITLPDLEIPHPRLALRRFVLLPLHEIFPDLRHPVTGQTITTLLQTCTDTGSVTALP
jgi:2-amino-4-hydroxy-6-hydroxymethyldihydropteridine diphosphokinase